jgi:hypothetical protein
VSVEASLDGENKGKKDQKHIEEKPNRPVHGKNQMHSHARDQ